MSRYCVCGRFSSYRGTSPSELRDKPAQTGSERRNLPKTQALTETKGHKAPRSLKSDLKLPDRHFSTFKACKVPPRRVSPVDMGHGCFSSDLLFPLHRRCHGSSRSRRTPGWHGITLHGHTEESGLRKPVKKHPERQHPSPETPKQAEQTHRGASGLRARA